MLPQNWIFRIIIHDTICSFYYNSVEKVLEQNQLWKKRGDKILLQQERISGSIKDLNVDFKQQLEGQNKTQVDLVHWIVSRITKTIDANILNVSHHLKQAKADGDHFRNSLNNTERKMNDLKNLTQMSLDLLRQTNYRGQGQLDEIRSLKDTVNNYIYNNSADHDTIKETLRSSQHIYDAKTKQLKLSISLIEYKILNWLTSHMSGDKSNRGEVDGQDAGVQELKLLEKGTN